MDPSELTRLYEDVASEAVDSVMDGFFSRLDAGDIAWYEKPAPLPAPVTDEEAEERQAEKRRRAKEYQHTTDLLRRAENLEERLRGRQLPNLSPLQAPPAAESESEDEPEASPAAAASGHLSRPRPVGVDGVYVDVDPETEDAMRQAETAKRMVRRLEREKRQRQKRLRQVQEAEAKALEREMQSMEAERQKKQALIEEHRKAQKELEMVRRREAAAERHRQMAELRVAEAAQAKERKKPPLYQRMEEKFAAKVEMPELERRKQRLHEIHAAFEQPALTDLDNHARQMKAMKRLQDEQERAKRMKREREWAERRPRSRGPFLDRVLEQDSAAKTEKARKAKKRAQMLKKRQRYAALVREVFAPKVDPKKAQEIAIIKAKAKEREGPEAFLPPPQPSDSSSPGGQPSRPGRVTRARPASDSEPSEYASPSRPARRRKRTNRSSLNAPAPKLQPSQLSEDERERLLAEAKAKAREEMKRQAERRKQRAMRKREQRSAPDAEPATTDPEERIHVFQRRAEHFEEKVEERERKIQSNVVNSWQEATNKEEVEEHARLTEMYVDAIKAKLALLRAVQE